MDIPLVHVRVNDHDALFAVDSGADTHVVTRTFARSLGMTPHDLVLDGDAVPVVDGVDTVLDGGWRVPQHSMLSIDLPPRMGVEANGIAGILSPQLLARDGEDVVVDVSRRTMTTVSAGDLASRLGAGVTLGLDACTPTAAFPSRSYRMRVLIEGEPFALKVDTGRANSALFAERVADVVPGVAGERVDVGFVLPSRDGKGDLRGGGKVYLSSDHVSPSAACKYDGVVGLDVLHRCVLAFGVRDGVATCKAR